MLYCSHFAPSRIWASLSRINSLDRQKCVTIAHVVHERRSPGTCEVIMKNQDCVKADCDTVVSAAN